MTGGNCEAVGELLDSSTMCQVSAENRMKGAATSTWVVSVLKVVSVGAVGEIESFLGNVKMMRTGKEQ